LLRIKSRTQYYARQTTKETESFGRRDLKRNGENRKQKEEVQIQGPEGDNEYINERRK